MVGNRTACTVLEGIIRQITADVRRGHLLERYSQTYQSNTCQVYVDCLKPFHPGGPIPLVAGYELRLAHLALRWHFFQGRRIPYD